MEALVWRPGRPYREGMVRGFVVAVTVLVAACGGGGEEKPAPAAAAVVCEAGRVTSCPCDGGSVATQTCKSDGSGWGECSCVAPADPSVACKFPLDPGSPNFRCPDNFVGYGGCESSAVELGYCFKTETNNFCCANVR